MYTIQEHYCSIVMQRLFVRAFLLLGTKPFTEDVSCILQPRFLTFHPRIDVQTFQKLSPVVTMDLYV